MNKEIQAYNDAQSNDDKTICEMVCAHINRHLPNAESKIWHGNPVWFLDGNPIVGYSKLKSSVQLLFWSGQSFETPGLEPEGGFKAAEARYSGVDQINADTLEQWLRESTDIQWDYKNIVKRRGVLERLK